VAGAAVATILAWYVSQRAAFKSDDGTLRASGVIRGMGWFCAAVAVAFLGGMIAWGVHPPLLLMFSVFGIGAFVFLAEGYRSRGRFDSEGIEFETLWTGKKSGRWVELSSVRFNASMKWYVLTFKDGTRIRLATFLNGHGRVLALVDERELERLARL
jgi:hypothetical protein